MHLVQNQINYNLPTGQRPALNHDEPQEPNVGAIIGRMDAFEHIINIIIEQGEGVANRLNQNIRVLNGRVNQLQQNNLELQNQLSALEYELDKTETERNRSEYYSYMNESATTVRAIGLAGGAAIGLACPPMLPFYAVGMGILKYTAPKFTDLNYFKECEDKYLEEHPDCLKSEAFAYARQKMNEAYSASQNENECGDAYSGVDHSI
ncbi:MAG: hypothetical protein H0V82_04175 [Candidatus Protochlamydia sp.]|nr:hypothetical protein [Candidatus Protochlamydia sp.]